MVVTSTSGDPYNSLRMTETARRETWLCRSTLDASDVEDDLQSLEHETTDDLSTDSMEEDTCEVEDEPTRPQPKPRSRKLTLGGHLDGARSHVLRRVLPPLAMTPSGISIGTATPHGSGGKKHCLKQPALHVKGPMLVERDVEMKAKRKEKQERGHMTIYMEYEREEGFGKSAKRPTVFVIRHVSGIYVALFLSTACMHCVSFNVNPAIRRLFRIETLPVGLCIVVAWTILGLVNCLGAGIGSRSNRVQLLRRLSWLWIVALVVLQLTRLPVASWFANTLVGIGYVAAVTAHGLLVPNVIAIGADIIATKVMAVASPDDEDSERRQQQSVDNAMGTFLTWGFGALLAASSLIQAFYFALVNLELSPGDDVLSLHNHRSVCITILCGVLLLALLVTFLYQSRHHYVPTPAAASTTDTSTCSTHAYERKLAQGDFASFTRQEECSPRVGIRQWFHLARRSVALCATGLFTLLLLVTVGVALIAQTVTDRASSTSRLVHLVLFATLSVGWITTMLLSSSQLAPSSRDKLYGHMDDLLAAPLLPSRQQVFVFVALMCLASATAFGAFVRAQLYTTLFIQTCQLHRPHDTAALYDPNGLGAWVGLLSVLLLPVLHWALRRKKPTASPRISAVRRVVIGVLLYLVAIFLSSVVELYRRASRWPTGVTATNPVAAGCVKSRASNLRVLWSLPQLIILSVADAVFCVAAAEEAYTLTAPLAWHSVAHSVLALADSVGYATALTLATTLSPWLFHVNTSDLVLLLLLITAIASLAYALTKRLADHIHASRRPRPLETSDEDNMVEDDNSSTEKRASVDDRTSTPPEANNKPQDESIDTATPVSLRSR